MCERDIVCSPVKGTISSNMQERGIIVLLLIKTLSQLVFEAIMVVKGPSPKGSDRGLNWSSVSSFP